MEGIDIAGYTSITAICFLIGSGIKISPLNDKWIPIIMGGAGAGLGIWAFFAGVPEFANSVIDAIARGIVSGLAATGLHQVYKQLIENKGGNEHD